MALRMDASDLERNQLIVGYPPSAPCGDRGMVHREGRVTGRHRPLDVLRALVDHAPGEVLNLAVGCLESCGL